MVFEILDTSGNVVNAIIAEQWFVDKYYPGRYREYVEPELAEDENEE